MAVQIGKRYSCPVCGGQLLVTKASEKAELQCHGQAMETARSKDLPASD